jgi:alanine racemase
MDMLTVDLTNCPQARIGSEVTLWGMPQHKPGKQGSVEENAEGLSIDEVAAAAGTVGYELMCALSERVPVNALS